MPDERRMSVLLAALGLHDVTEATPTSGNSGAATWRVVHAGGTSAVRIFPVGSDHAVERERRVMEAAQRAGLPVPAIQRMNAWEGHPVMILDWLLGRTIAAELAAQPWRAWRLGQIFGQMHAVIHQVPAPAGIPTWLDWLPEADASLRERLGALAPQSARLLHLDYHPLNVLTDGAHITGVLDWTNALAGPPRADVARTVAILRLDSGAPSLARSAVVWGFMRGWQAGYRANGGRLDGMAPFHAWAGATMAADLAPKRPPDQLARIRRWRTRWQHQMDASTEAAS